MAYLRRAITRRWQLICGGLAALGLLAALAAAAVASTSPPAGAAVALKGTGACLGHGCTTQLRPFHGKGSPGDNGLQLTMATGSHYVYAVENSPAVIDVLARNARTGRLTQLPGGKGCLTGKKYKTCTHVAALTGHPVTINAGGVVTVQLAHHQKLLLRLNPATGNLKRIGTEHGCTKLNLTCGDIRGIHGTATAVQYAPGSALATGYARGKQLTGAFTIFHRGANGRWHGVAGKTGCITGNGTGGCTKLPCVGEYVNTAHLSSNGKLLYVGGGDTDPESTYGGFLATFKLTSAGGLIPVSCVSTGNNKQLEAANVPVWIQPLPHSNKVLVAEEAGNRGISDGEWIAVTKPAANGGLGKPRVISKGLASILGPLTLSPDGRTLYSVGSIAGGNGYFEVLRVTPTSVKRLPAPYGFPYRSGNLGTDFATSMVFSADHRFVYIGTFAGDSVRAYRIAP